MKKVTTTETRSQITVLSNNNLIEKPSAYPTLPTLGKFAKSLGIDLLSKKIDLNTSIVLNAQHPEEIGKMKLIVPVNNYLSINNYYKPYYYEFAQWGNFFDVADGVWGKVTIHFERGFLVQDGIIFLRVGGYLNEMMGRGYNIFDGKKNIYVDSKHGPNDNFRWISQTIPVHIQKSLLQSNILDITITSRLHGWKFFDAKYSTILISRPR